MMNIQNKKTKLKAFFERHFSATTDNKVDLNHELNLACAALMLEMLRADDVVLEEELHKLLELLQDKFAITAEETVELIEIARDKMHNSTDYFEFTSLLNKHYTQEQKTLLIKNLWELALADKHIDKYEEHLVRNLAELLHVPHASFIKMKLHAQSAID